MLHRWKPCKKPGFDNHMICEKCGLEYKPIYGFPTVFYLKSDDAGKITEYGIGQKRIPYTCPGAPKPLPDELFEI